MTDSEKRYIFELFVKYRILLQERVICKILKEWRSYEYEKKKEKKEE